VCRAASFVSLFNILPSLLNLHFSFMFTNHPFYASRRLLFYLMLILISFMAGNCKKDASPGRSNSITGEDPLKTAADVTTTVIGTVVDEKGEPLSGVDIMVHGYSTTTSQLGTFELSDIDVPGNRCLVSCNKDGYFEGSRAEIPRKNGTTEIRIVLMTKATTHIINAASGGKAALANGSEVQIPANALVDATGNPYTGTVNMSVRYLDPTKPDFGMLVPGGDMLAQRTDQATSMLYSYGILRVKMTGNNGDDLQIAEGKQATLVMDIPDKQLSTAPASIPLWFFDEEKGVWIEEGSAAKQGDKYVGSVKHFTDWNCDVPEDAATIIGTLVDCNGEASWGHIEFGQVGEDVGSSTDSDQSNGAFSQRVPANTPLTVVVHDPLYIAPLLPGEQGKGKLIVVVPPLSPGQVYDVGKLQIFPCLSTLKANFKLKAGDQLDYLLFETANGGMRYVWDPKPNFELKGFSANTGFTLTAKTKSGISLMKAIQTSAPGATLDLGTLDLSNVQESYIIGKLVCGTTPTSSGQVTASWDGRNEYDIPDADGSFQVVVPLNQTIELTITTEKGTLRKTVTTSAVAGSVQDLGVIDFCAGPQPGENSFIINGDGFVNALKTFKIQPFPQSTSIYTSSSNLTYLSVFDESQAYRFTLSFTGKATGNVKSDENTMIFIQFKSGTQIVNYIAGQDLKESSAQINVARYDAVGGLVEGTFSGTFVKDDGTAKVTVTNGKFSVIRYSDL
jgi:hypothetical protein